MTSITSLCELACQVVQKKREEKRIKEEQAAKAQTWKLFDDDNDEERSDSLDDNIISGHPLFSAITPNEPVLSTEEPDNSLSIGDKHLDTIPATESDQFIKFGVENLILIPSESKGIPEHMSFLNDDHSSDFTTKSSSTSHNSLLEETNNFYNSSPEFTTFSNVLCDAECESDSSDDQSCSDEDVLEKIVSKPLSEEEIIPMESLHIRLIEKLLYDNSSPHPPEEFVSDNFNADIESFSPSPIPIKDSDSVMEEIDLVCTPDYLMPPSIKDEDYDSERDILIPKDLPSNNSLSFVEKESFHFDIPLFSRPPAKPPDGDTGIFNIKMMGDISDQKAFMYKLMITLASYQEKSPDLISHRQIMAPVTRQGQNPPPPNTDTPPHHMTPKSVQAMIDQALLRNSTNGDGSQSSHEDNPRHVETTRPCFYADFMKCHPLNFKGNEGVVGLTRWIEKIEFVFNISCCVIENQGELKKLEIKLWNLKLVANENEKIDKYISGLLDNIYRNVKSSKPRSLDEIIELTNDLMDQKLCTYAERADNKRKTDDMSRNNHGHQQQPFKKSSGNANVANAQRDGKETPKGNVGNEEKNKNAPMNPDSNVVMVISCSKAQEYMAKGCKILMAQISAKKEEDKSEGKQLKDVPIVWDFPEVFPEDLLGLRPARPVEFQNDLIPGAAPVAQAPYRFALFEMKELSEQLQELSDKGFIRPSSSPWGAPVMFSKRRIDHSGCVLTTGN
nr:putative reverse transcriptase domain-containing protein [Tanacetum cinerariifolium]